MSDATVTMADPARRRETVEHGIGVLPDVGAVRTLELKYGYDMGCHDLRPSR